MQRRLASNTLEQLMNFRFFSLCLLSGIVGLYYHAQAEDQTPGFGHARQALYQMSYGYLFLKVILHF